MSSGFHHPFELAVLQAENLGGADGVPHGNSENGRHPTLAICGVTHAAAFLANGHESHLDNGKAK